MSDQSNQNKTEEPTQRRLERAANEGQIAFSSDLSSGILLCFGSIFFMAMGPSLGQQLQMSFRIYLRDIFQPEFTTVFATRLSNDVMMQLAGMVLPMAVCIFAIMLVAGSVVTGFRVSAKPLMPDLNKVNPQKGLERLFSSRAVVRGVIAIVKVTVMTAIAYAVIQSQMLNIFQTAGTSVSESISLGWSLTTQIAAAVSAAMLFVGAADLIFQKWKHHQDMKMTRQEVMDEYKEDQGDPHLNARIKKVQREIVEKQMFKDVPTADVILKNPTHIAVALRYDRGKDPAPIVVAKGEEETAKLIVKLAEEHGVPVLERKPLARALYYAVEVGQEIPLELYQAIAEILAYVQRQRTILNR